MHTAIDQDNYLFYACTMISFLESRVDTYVDNLKPFFECDSSILDWLQQTWLPEEAEHGRLMRRYVEDRWQNYQWENGFNAFSAQYVPQCATEKLRRSISLEALARCVTEAETTMIYRCIACYADDPALKQLLKRMSADEVRHYTQFKKIHKQYESLEQNKLPTKLNILFARSQLVRDEDLALAFAPLNHHWQHAIPFKPWRYQRFLNETSRIMKAHFPYAQAKRMLFSPIKSGRFFEKYYLNALARLIAWQFCRKAPPVASGDF